MKTSQSYIDPDEEQFIHDITNLFHTSMKTGTPHSSGFNLQSLFGMIPGLGSSGGGGLPGMPSPNLGSLLGSFSHGKFDMGNALSSLFGGSAGGSSGGSSSGIGGILRGLL